MITNNIVQPTNVKVSEVSNLLSCASDVASCCLSTSINKNSKSKPTDDNYRSNYGMTLPRVSSLTLAKAQTLFSGGEEWGAVYNRPTSAYHLGDFKNYDHAARQPIEGEVEMDIMIDSTNHRYTILWYRPNVGSSTAIDLADMSYMGGVALTRMYPAAVIRLGSRYFIATSATKLTNDGRDNSFNVEFTDPAEYISTTDVLYAIPVLCDEMHNNLIEVKSNVTASGVFTNWNNTQMKLKPYAPSPSVPDHEWTAMPVWEGIDFKMAEMHIYAKNNGQSDWDTSSGYTAVIYVGRDSSLETVEYTYRSAFLGKNLESGEQVMHRVLCEDITTGDNWYYRVVIGDFNSGVLPWPSVDDSQ